MQTQTGTDAIWLLQNPLMKSNITTTKTFTGEMDDEMKKVQNESFHCCHIQCLLHLLDGEGVLAS